MIELSLRNSWSKNEFVCELTKTLDSLAVFNPDSLRYHYLLIENEHERNIPIRVPGGTVGVIKLNDDNFIKDIIIDKNYVVSTYSPNTDEVMHTYIGQELMIH